MRKLLIFIVLFSWIKINAQDVQLFSQFGGRLDFTMFGNTMNLQENGFSSICQINTSSSAVLTLLPEDEIKSAYLYWAGSGDGDFQVKLNDSIINATRIFRDTLETRNLNFFSAFADVTEHVLETGNGNYTLSELDISDVIADYCPNATNFAGWSILVVYKNDDLELNQINIYDGLQHVPNELNITLNNLNVIDNIGAKIGFLAWEGDRGLSVNESLFVNGNLISNPPLNPGNNAFNGTNSFTGETDLYNMDMDFYDIQNNISAGDTSATVQLTSGQDFVMINTVVTKLNSQLPDATVTIDNVTPLDCSSKTAQLNFTIKNENSTELLPANTTINIYANSTLLETLQTTEAILIDEFEFFETIVTIPTDLLPDFTLTVIVDEENAVLEINDDNNSDSLEISYPEPPNTIELQNLETCNLGFEKGNFNFSETLQYLEESYPLEIAFTFYPSEEDLLAETNSINPIIDYTNNTNSQTIFVKTQNINTNCYVINSFEIKTYNCPPTIYNIFSANEDGINDQFEITGLENIYTDYQIFIYNRYGKLVFEGNNNKPLWRGKLLTSTENVPSATYFYTLVFNDGITETITGWVYVGR
ncbi:gliding motility-associated C-terminal domain-containing protein [Tenacibaculum sp. 1_MG-2023]|uniref:T9SS type B sorting domain-containing protein n=1 Tax=Tenacibaculum sp. 1_MG-2023 TaxID=3062653 RepID=UPI0026E3377A|nr:gliding motility-associated C-terminal domain-containing protein [Tenacibaculum sp. 1_MG-2023]MDO6600006.1 gliding motility-associated C-terminal domain-containing protein [Tenacibaculum sp. 1_MG-2023]